MSGLIIMAHPDDEVLGCGGTIRRLVDEGQSVDIVFATDGVGSRDGGSSHRVTRREASEAALLTLGVRNAEHLGFADNRLDKYDLLDIVTSVEKIVRKLKPKFVITHHFGDLNVDHRIMNQVALTACRPEPDSSVKMILAAEVLSSTEWQVPTTSFAFIPNYFYDISTIVVDVVVVVVIIIIFIINILIF